ncbi:hypothetical protein NLR71_004831 [Escherichia coli]|uniref:hypothetical protein n=1 Tax=Escherichia coli TaxID=562 RepID=UPI00053094E0|nr:hypothetical protein [Escherichia coli]EFA8840092.1 hypothetical protein [Escherichia coli O88:H4]EES4900836.1 hypothetical protein [Escherichia coli]EFH9440192.1 hypothetical protein [Escherichia coli]EGI9634718.1 hypothetical protein [Escherichia coli]EHL6329198.1 hypothetical protein [Escherichia coli]
MIKTRRTKRTFSPEFKLEVIEQVVKYCQRHDVLPSYITGADTSVLRGKKVRVTNGAIVIHTQRLKSDPGGNLLS